MNCPCKSLKLVNDEAKARAELNRIYENDPDSDWEIWDVYCFAEMDLCDDCYYLEERKSNETVDIRK